MLITRKPSKKCERYSQESMSAADNIDEDITETLESACEAQSQVFWRLSDSLSFSSAGPSGHAI